MGGTIWELLGIEQPKYSGTPPHEPLLMEQKSKVRKDGESYWHSQGELTCPYCGGSYVRAYKVEMLDGEDEARVLFSCEHCEDPIELSIHVHDGVSLLDYGVPLNDETIFETLLTVDD